LSDYDPTNSFGRPTFSRRRPSKTQNGPSGRRFALGEANERRFLFESSTDTEFSD
jgi:hypothetical protein